MNGGGGGGGDGGCSGGDGGCGNGDGGDVPATHSHAGAVLHEATPQNVLPELFVIVGTGKALLALDFLLP